MKLYPRRLLLLLIAFLLLFVDDLNAGKIRIDVRKSIRKNRIRMLKIQKHLKNVNKPAIKTIRSPDGDLIDCVLTQHQPAFDHPKLRDHAFQNMPSTLAFPLQDGIDDEQQEFRQHWHENGECPQGSVPIRRTTIDDILRVGSVSRYGRKFHAPIDPSIKNFLKNSSSATQSLVENQVPPEPIDSSGHEHAISYISGEFYGAQGSLNVWRPVVDVPNEFSLSQIWLLGGSFSNDLNSIEAGWQVSPEIYGDNNPRLFTYWTSDSYQATGCYNLLCSGFIQTGNNVAIGGSIFPISAFDGPQYDIKILIWKDPRTGNWWMRLGERTLVGYWPAEIFSHLLTGSASMIEWGGEIVNTEPQGGHTTTQMGSGRFPSQGFAESSYFRNLGVVDATNELVTHLPSIRTLAEKPNCYSIARASNADWGDYFYYGGPGGSSNTCH